MQPNKKKKIQCPSFYTAQYLNYLKEIGYQIFYRHERLKDNDYHAVCPYRIHNRILTGYHYGGLFVSKKKDDFINWIKIEFIKEAKSKGVERIILRNHPFTDMIPLGKKTLAEEILYIDLEDDEEQLKRSISKGHRKNIEKSIHNNIKIRFHKNLSPKHITKLLDSYQETKIKNDKSIRSDIKTIRYPQDTPRLEMLFKHCNRDLILIEAIRDSKVIATSLIFKGKSNAYMIFGTNSLDGKKYFAKHRIIYELMLMLKSKGFKRLILGTGLSKKDTIFNFKKRFGSRTIPIESYTLRL